MRERSRRVYNQWAPGTLSIYIYWTGVGRSSYGYVRSANMLVHNINIKYNSFSASFHFHFEKKKIHGVQTVKRTRAACIGADRHISEIILPRLRYNNVAQHFTMLLPCCPVVTEYASAISTIKIACIIYFNTIGCFKDEFWFKKNIYFYLLLLLNVYLL